MVGSLPVRALDELEEIVAQQQVAIGVIATPAAGGAGGLRPPGGRGRHQHLELRPGRARRCPTGVDVRKVDLSIELQILAYHEQRKALARPLAGPLASTGDDVHDLATDRPAVGS